jgi:hypothetical protein
MLRSDDRVAGSIWVHEGPMDLNEPYRELGPFGSNTLEVGPCGPNGCNCGWTDPGAAKTAFGAERQGSREVWALGPSVDLAPGGVL